MTIDTLEAIQVGGTTQWIRVRGADASNPVLLLIQQGPGMPGPLGDQLRRSHDQRNLRQPGARTARQPGPLTRLFRRRRHPDPPRYHRDTGRAAARTRGHGPGPHPAPPRRARRHGARTPRPGRARRSRTAVRQFPAGIQQAPGLVRQLSAHTASGGTRQVPGPPHGNPGARDAPGRHLRQRTARAAGISQQPPVSRVSNAGFAGCIVTGRSAPWPAGPGSAGELVDGGLGDGGEEVDEVAVGIAEQQRPVAPRHRGGLVDEFLDEAG